MPCEIIDALRLERWFLKTLINLSFEGPLLIGVNGAEPGRPSRDLLSIVFGDSPFAGRAGMYVAATVNHTIESKDLFQCAPLIHADKTIVGALFKFRGLHAALALYPEGPGPEGFAFNPHLGPYWRELALLRPFDRIDYAPWPQFVAHEIVFDWGSKRPAADKQYLTHEEVLQRFLQQVP